MALERFEKNDQHSGLSQCVAERCSGCEGVDPAERPVVLREEPAKLEVGMVVSLHPAARIAKAMTSISDTYVITNSDVVPLYENLFDDNEIFAGS